MASTVPSTPYGLKFINQKKKFKNQELDRFEFLFQYMARELKDIEDRLDHIANILDYEKAYEK